MFDPLRIAIAMIPIGTYLVVMGLIRFKKTPTVISRPLDLLLLGMACVGIVAIGPIELFFPRAAFSVVGNWVWLVLLSLYSLLVLLMAFHVPPGIVIYGVSKETIKSLIINMYAEKNAELGWLGDSFQSNSLNISAQVEDAGWNSVTHIKAIGKDQNIAEWINLDRALHERCASVPPAGRSSGMAWFSIGVAIVLAGFGLLVADIARVNETLAQLFQTR